MENFFAQRLIFVATFLLDERIKFVRQRQCVCRKAIVQNGLFKEFLFGIFASEFYSLHDIYFFAAQNFQIHKQDAGIKIIFGFYDAFTAKKKRFCRIGSVVDFTNYTQSLVFKIDLPKFFYVKINYRIGIKEDNFFNFFG